MAVRQVYFHTPTEAEANRCIDSTPLTVNCTGTEHFLGPFRRTSNRKDYGMVYVVRGEMYFHRQNHTRILKEGEFSIGPPVSQNEFGSTCDQLDYYWLQFTGSEAADLAAKIGLKYGTSCFIGVQDEIMGLFEDIFKEFQFHDNLFDQRVGARLILLLSAVVRQLEKPDHTYLHSLGYIHKHYNEALSISQLAAMEGYSRSYYQTVFRQKLGISPQNYIIRQRIEAACFYLKSSSYSVAEIANLVGYSDPYYFSRIFRQKMSCSPLHYRKNNH